MRIACRRLTSQDAEVQEIKRDDDEYDEIMSTKFAKTTPDPSGENDILKVRCASTKPINKASLKIARNYTANRLSFAGQLQNGEGWGKRLCQTKEQIQTG